YTRKLRYLPFPAAFSIDASAIDKFIFPLYGDSPSIGVRELMQNSLDSIRERAHLENGGERYVVDIKLFSSGEKKYIEVRDQGRGMDSTVILKYLFGAG